jgi:hypothetical protein
MRPSRPFAHRLKVWVAPTPSSVRRCLARQTEAIPRTGTEVLAAGEPDERHRHQRQEREAHAEDRGDHLAPATGMSAFGLRLVSKDRGMQIDKRFVLDELRKAGKNEHVQQAIQELPEKVDHDQHAAMLEKFGLDPGKLAQKAAERGLAEL